MDALRRCLTLGSVVVVGVGCARPDRRPPQDAVENELLRATPLIDGLVGWEWTQATANWYRRFRNHGSPLLDSALAERPGERTPIEQAMEIWELEHPQPIVTVSDVAEHFDYVRRLIGAEYIGIGSDFEGDPSVVEGLEDVSKYPNLLTELARRGWTTEELRMVSGENFLRVLREADEAASR